jgi:hypothetical protein
MENIIIDRNKKLKDSNLNKFFSKPHQQPWSMQKLEKISERRP